MPEKKIKFKILIVFQELGDFDSQLLHVIKQELSYKPDFKFYFLQGKGQKELYKYLKETVNQFDYFIFSTQRQILAPDLIKALSSLPSKKLLLLNTIGNELHGNFSSIYRDDEKSIQQALSQLMAASGQYNKVVLLFSDNQFYPSKAFKGFEAYASKNDFAFSIQDVHAVQISKGSLYIVFSENELYLFLKQLINLQKSVCTKIGLFSLISSPYCDVLPMCMNYLTTDTYKTGKLIAEIIEAEKVQHAQIPYKFIMCAPE